MKTDTCDAYVIISVLSGRYGTPDEIFTGPTAKADAEAECAVRQACMPVHTYSVMTLDDYISDIRERS